MNRFQLRISTFILLLPIILANSPAFAHPPTIHIQSPETITPVLELYTSEGCSSCPPADRWLSSLKPKIGKSLHVVPLAFHVDYWNYLGWQDVYSNPVFTARQRKLGEQNRQRSIYTPEFFVDGQEKRGDRKILSTIEQLSRKKSDWTLELDVFHETGNTLGIRVNARPNADAQSQHVAELFIGLYENNIRREIERGENAGKRLQQDFVVREWIGPVDAGYTNRLFHSQQVFIPADAVPENTGIALVLSEKNTGRNLQALSVNLGDLFATANNQ